MTVSSPEPDCGRRTAGAGAAETLKYGFRNSHFQTGFTNPLDAAILSGVPEPVDLATYRKLAERPYDFTRRFLSVVLQREGDVPLLVTKGAPESVVARASHVREDHTTRPIEAAEHERLAKLVDSASARPPTGSGWWRWDREPSGRTSCARPQRVVRRPASTMRRASSTTGLVHRIAVHAGSRRPRHPHPAEPVLAERRPSPQLAAVILAALLAAVIVPLSPLGDVLGFTRPKARREQPRSDGLAGMREWAGSRDAVRGRAGSGQIGPRRTGSRRPPRPPGGCSATRRAFGRTTRSRSSRRRRGSWRQGAAA